jgi:hypothetical protein
LTVKLNIMDMDTPEKQNTETPATTEAEKPGLIASMVNGAKKLFSTEAAATQEAPGKKKEWEYTDSHLRANLPPDADKPKPSVRAVSNMAEMERRNNLPLPGDYNGLIAEHQYLWNLRTEGLGPVPPDTHRLAAARHKLVIAAINALQNGSARPVRPGPGEHFVSGRARPGRSAARETVLAACKTALELEKETPGYFYGLPLTPSREVPPWAKWLLNQDTVTLSIGDGIAPASPRLQRGANLSQLPRGACA